MSDLELAAIRLHDFLWENVAIERLSDEWPLEICGDRDSLPRFCVLMNALQDAIVASGYGRRKYSGRMP
jgi:hypothetical protein